MKFRNERVGKKQQAETKPRFVNMPASVIYVIKMWAEAKILKEKTNWTVRVLKVFTLSYIASLRTVIKIKHS